jgi:hypothetical protein
VGKRAPRAGTPYARVLPNITSVERLTRFYEEDANYFCLLILTYAINDVVTDVRSALFVPIEYVSWQSLTIGALGWGQIQIANMRRIAIDDGASREQWMVDLCSRVGAFYAREHEKIRLRAQHFEAVETRWARRVALAHRG